MPDVPRYRWIEPERPAGNGDLASLGLIGEILFSRGAKSRTDVQSLLNCTLDSIPDPATLPDIQTATSLISGAIQSSHRIGVFGDYDVDGVTSTALLTNAISGMGADVRPYLPHRERDGYGLNVGAIDQMVLDGCRLLIAVDCGTSDVRELEYAASKGLRTVVIDHHHVPTTLPPCDAFVSPRRSDSQHPYPDYAAVGVAFQVMRHMIGEDGVEQFLPLVALGTVADVVPLTGPNRAIVHHGLAMFDEFAGPGLRALAGAAGVTPGAIRSHHLGFMLGPRINAAGRIGDPRIALHLLLTESESEAAELAARLDSLNRERQSLLNEYIEQARRIIEFDGALDDPVLVVHSPDWKIGLAGLIASRLCDQYGRPAFALEQSSTLSRGSARSIDEFNVVEALHKCSELLDQFGGHSKAAGLTLKTNQLLAFTERINEVFVDELGPVPPLPALQLDAELAPDDVSLGLIDELHQLEPCGHGNPPPKFLIRAVLAEHVKCTRTREHLQFKVPRLGGQSLDAIAFGAGNRLNEMHRGKLFDLAVTLRRDNWRGRSSAKLEIVDFRPAERPLVR